MCTARSLDLWTLMKRDQISCVRDIQVVRSNSSFKFLPPTRFRIITSSTACLPLNVGEDCRLAVSIASAPATVVIETPIVQNVQRSTVILALELERIRTSALTSSLSFLPPTHECTHETALRDGSCLPSTEETFVLSQRRTTRYFNFLLLLSSKLCLSRLVLAMKETPPFPPSATSLSEDSARSSGAYICLSVSPHA
jgi:hypothetical protein